MNPLALGMAIKVGLCTLAYAVLVIAVVVGALLALPPFIGIPATLALTIAACAAGITYAIHA